MIKKVLPIINITTEFRDKKFITIESNVGFHYKVFKDNGGIREICRILKIQTRKNIPIEYITDFRNILKVERNNFFILIDQQLADICTKPLPAN